MAEQTSQSEVLLLDFNWKKNTASVSKEHASDAGPLYTVSIKTFSSTPLTFVNQADGSIFGTGRTHLISINADCTLHEKHFKLEATRRLKTAYTNQSQTLRSADGVPVQLYWSTETDYSKTWTFICTGEQSRPVVKLEYNVWAVKKFGKIEFAEGQQVSEDLRREMVVTAVTLLYCMLMRMNNVFALVGSALHRKPKLAENTSDENAAVS